MRKYRHNGTHNADHNETKLDTMNRNQISRAIKALSNVNSEHAASARLALLQLRDELDIKANPSGNYGGDGGRVWSRSPGGVRPAVTLGEWEARKARARK